ncbi:hypothetical protein H9L17_15185 [Thermomonas brevis]|uniref:Transmembrane repetitive protein n=1 Tax=Thermomonas brevis TaxID=215691 RepID=A0A7G9QT07_9GAMM|nr:hypothetical protein [Thermomonas brevis]QNN46482.1 hypothetical protein H9L17_15185 [Thermomonas brevis]
MTTAADVIAALNQRRLLKLGKPEAAGEMPAGWQRWFDAMPQADAGAARARIEAWVQPLARGLTYSAQSKATRLGLPFFHLQRLGRPADPRDERALRIGVGAVDIVLHVLLAALLLWLMYLRFMELSKQGDEEDGSVVQVEFIGRGNAATGGGALANAGAQSAQASASPARNPAPTPAPQATETPAPADAPPAIEQVATPAPQAIDASREIPPLERTPPAPPQARQVLQVSEVPQPQPDGFKLPPPRERSVVLPQAQLREVQPRQQVETISTLETQPIRTLQPTQRQVQLRAPELKEQVREIEVFTPDASALARERAVPAASDRQAQVQVPQLRGQVREIPLKADGGGTPAAQPGNGVAASGKAPTARNGADKAGATGAGQAQAGTGQGARAAQAGGRGVTAAGSGAGPGLKPAPGGWPGAAKSDDWGASKRNVAGTGNGNGRDGDGKSGLFNGDGSARLPDEWSDQNGVDLDRAGTWLKRPGLEYKATRFDKYWIPQGTLLQEWVRRGIKELSIPIPGTGIKLKCVVSLLALGGGCLPVDPDVNEQSSTGRAAPDVPFKPELQEDNGSVRAPEPAAKPGG